MIWATFHVFAQICRGDLRVPRWKLCLKSLLGKSPRIIVFGKAPDGYCPFATWALQQWRKGSHGIDCSPDTVYFVSDTPEPDIHGANEFVEPDSSLDHGCSVLFLANASNEGTNQEFMPRMTLDSVLAATRFVKWEPPAAEAIPEQYAVVDWKRGSITWHYLSSGSLESSSYLYRLANTPYSKNHFIAYDSANFRLMTTYVCMPEHCNYISMRSNPESAALGRVVMYLFLRRIF